MLKVLFTLMLVIGLSAGSMYPYKNNTEPVVEPTTAIERQHANTHRIGVYDLPGVTFNSEVGHCSGTVVGPHAILTAQHCLRDSAFIRLDAEKNPIRIMAALFDNNDHVIYIVDRTFTTWTPIVQRELVVNEPVHFWGAPGKNSDVYRIGYFQKMTTMKELDPDGKFQFQLFILPVFGGDSGSGILDESGNVIAVVSMADTSADNLDLPLAFTPGQLDVATK